MAAEGFPVARIDEHEKTVRASYPCIEVSEPTELLNGTCNV